MPLVNICITAAHRGSAKSEVSGAGASLVPKHTPALAQPRRLWEGGKRSDGMQDAHTSLFRDSTSTSALIQKQRGCVAAVLRDKHRGSQLSCILTGQSLGRMGRVGTPAAESRLRGHCSGTEYMSLQFAVWQNKEKPKTPKNKKKKRTRYQVGCFSDLS